MNDAAAETVSNVTDDRDCQHCRYAEGSKHSIICKQIRGERAGRLLSAEDVLLEHSARQHADGSAVSTTPSAHLPVVSQIYSLAGCRMHTILNGLQERLRRQADQDGAPLLLPLNLVESLCSCGCRIVSGRIIRAVSACARQSIRLDLSSGVACSRVQIRPDVVSMA